MPVAQQGNMEKILVDDTDFERLMINVSHVKVYILMLQVHRTEIGRLAAQSTF